MEELSMLRESFEILSREYTGEYTMAEIGRDLKRRIGVEVLSRIWNLTSREGRWCVFFDEYDDDWYLSFSAVRFLDKDGKLMYYEARNAHLVKKVVFFEGGLDLSVDPDLIAKVSDHKSVILGRRQ